MGLFLAIASQPLWFWNSSAHAVHLVSLCAPRVTVTVTNSIRLRLDHFFNSIRLRLDHFFNEDYCRM